MADPIWVVAEVDPFISNARNRQGLVSLHGGIYKRRTTLIEGDSDVRLVVKHVSGKKVTVLWTVHPKRRMQANVDARRKRPRRAQYVTSQDFRPWQQTKRITR